MEAVSHPYQPGQDRRAALDLFATTRAAAPQSRYNYLTHYRLDLLLASRLLEPERDARVWLDMDGSLVGFAMLWRRSRERCDVTLEAFADPRTPPEEFDARALRWASERGAELAGELSDTFGVVAITGEREQERAEMLRRTGFSEVEGYPVRVAGALPKHLQSAPAPVLPEGFTLRRLDAQADVDSYCTLYDRIFSPVGADYRHALLRDPDYAHIVATAPDGALVAFCECSVTRTEWALGGRREGEIDYLGTLDGFQRRGLASGLLGAAMRQLREWGAEAVSLITGRGNEQAQRLYRHAGMEVVDRARVYRLDIAPSFYGCG